MCFVFVSFYVFAYVYVCRVSHYSLGWVIGWLVCGLKLNIYQDYKKRSMNVNGNLWNDIEENDRRF